jgi:hypothetical protein
MIGIFQFLKNKVKDKLWIWRPILLFAAVGLVTFIIVSGSSQTSDQLQILRSSESVTKVEIKIGTNKPVTYLTLTDPLQLDSIGKAFRSAEEKSIPHGGAFTTWAQVHVYKGSYKVDLFIQHSAQNGWMVAVGNATLTNEYLFALIRRYAQAKGEKLSR